MTRSAKVLLPEPEMTCFLFLVFNGPSFLVMNMSMLNLSSEAASATVSFLLGPDVFFRAVADFFVFIWDFMVFFAEGVLVGAFFLFFMAFAFRLGNLTLSAALLKVLGFAFLALAA